MESRTPSTTPCAAGASSWLLRSVLLHVTGRRPSTRWACGNSQPDRWLPRYAFREPYLLDSRARQTALARYICRGVRQATRIRSLLATTTAIARARDVATFSRCGSYRNSSPRGASSADDVAIE